MEPRNSPHSAKGKRNKKNQFVSDFHEVGANKGRLSPELPDLKTKKLCQNARDTFSTDNKFERGMTNEMQLHICIQLRTLHT